MRRSGFRFKIKKRKVVRSSLPIVRYMTYLLIVTVTLSGVSLSRYATSLASEDQARAARFDVTVSHASWSIDEYNDRFVVQTIDGSQEYTFTVTNNSEVAIQARLVIVSSTSSVAPDPSDWQIIPANESRDITITIAGSFTGNNVQLFIEYEQID